MGKRGGARKAQTSIFGSNNSITLREETTGKRLGKGGSANVKSILKVEHLERLAVWTSGEASMPSLGAFFGHRLASAGEALGIPPNPSLFSCRRFVKFFIFISKIWISKTPLIVGMLVVLVDILG